MLERSEPVLRLLCLVLAGLLCYRIAKVTIQKDPFQGLKVPAVLKSDSFAADKATNAPTKTSVVAANVVSQVTNSAATNNAIAKGTNTVSASNAVAVANSSTNTSTATNIAASLTNAAGSNVVARSTNALPPDLVARAANPALASGRRSTPPGMPPGFPGMPGMPGAMGKPGPPLPAPIQARVDKIVQSEILGAIVRPMPMALIGIAGRDAIIRTPNGQTGLMREGEELGGIKLLKIGTNRVLVEHEGEKKELMLFSGLGSQTLLSKEKETPK